MESFDRCREILRTAKQRLGEILSSFELLDAETMRCIKENTGMDTVLSSRPPFNLLIETSGLEYVCDCFSDCIAGSSEEHDGEKMEKFLEHCLETQLANDGILVSLPFEFLAMPLLFEGWKCFGGRLHVEAERECVAVAH